MTSRMRSRGATTIEVALAAIVFFMLILAIIDLGRLHFFRSRLQYAVSQATRFAVIGQSATESGKAMGRRDSIVHMVKKLSKIHDLKASDIVITSRTSDGKTVTGAGGPGDVVTVVANYKVPILAPYLSMAFEDGQYAFAARTTYRNEEFSPSASDVGETIYPSGSGSSGSGRSGSGSSGSSSSGSNGGSSDDDSDSD